MENSKVKTRLKIFLPLMAVALLLVLLAGKLLLAPVVPTGLILELERSGLSRDPDQRASFLVEKSTEADAASHTNPLSAAIAQRSTSVSLGGVRFDLDESDDEKLVYSALVDGTTIKIHCHKVAQDGPERWEAYSTYLLSNHAQLRMRLRQTLGLKNPGLERN